MGRTENQMMTNNSKDVDFNKVLSSLNQALSKTQSDVFINDEGDQASVHIIGAPRSGTTLLNQILLTYLDVGYVNNLIAAFFSCPVYGIRLSRQLLGDDFSSQMASEFGRTSYIQEPHEFSYFWKKHLNYPDFLQRTYDENHRINWAELKLSLYQMTLAYNRPMVYKSFQYGFHATEAVIRMPKTLFIHIERDLFQNAYSILKLRRAQFKNEEHWASIKPVQYDLLKNENKYRQIIGQVLFLNHEYKKQLDGVPEHNKLYIGYRKLCLNPSDVIKQLLTKINLHSPVAKSNEPIKILKENIVEIPEDVLEGFRKAEIWVRTQFPELKKYNV